MEIALPLEDQYDVPIVTDTDGHVLFCVSYSKKYQCEAGFDDKEEENDDDAEDVEPLHIPKRQAKPPTVQQPALNTDRKQCRTAPIAHPSVKIAAKVVPKVTKSTAMVEGHGKQGLEKRREKPQFVAAPLYEGDSPTVNVELDEEPQRKQRKVIGGHAVMETPTPVAGVKRKRH